VFGDFSGSYFSDKQYIADFFKSSTLTAKARVGAVRTCISDKKLAGLQVGLADFASLQSTRVTPKDVTWLTPIGTVSGNGQTCDVYYVAKGEGITAWKISYTRSTVEGSYFMTSDGDYRLYGTQNEKKLNGKL